MTSVIKENSTPGTFVPFQMKQVNESAYTKSVEYVASRNANIWTIVIEYMSEGAFFKLEDKIKALPSIEHVFYDPRAKKARVLVPRSSFHQQRELIKDQLKKWTIELDPEDTRKYDSPPEVSHIPKDDFSSDAGSYFTHSIASIMTFEVEKVVVRNEQKKNAEGQETYTATTPSEISIPPVISTVSQEESEVSILKAKIAHYQKDLAILSTRLETMSSMLELLLKKVELNKEEEDVDGATPKRDWRQRYKFQEDS